MKYHENKNPDNGNVGNVFWRAALGMLFLYLNFAAYQLLGIEAVAVTSGFLLVAQFAPFFLRMFGKRRECRFPQAPEIFTETNDEKESTKVIPIRLVRQAEQKGL